MRFFLDKFAKQRLVYPLRKIALMVAKHWPFPVRATLSNGEAMWVDLRSSIGRAVLVKGEFDQGVWNAIEPRLSSGSVFLDVGANVGYYSMLASEKVGANGYVYAFEIDPRPLRCLKKNASECGRHNIVVHDLAVGGVVGQCVLIAKEDCGHSYVQLAGQGVQVDMITLDRWIKNPVPPDRIDFIKLDIEGGELDALDGARTLIKVYRPMIVCEALSHIGLNGKPNQENLLNFFASMNYSTRFINGVHSPTILAEPK